MHVHSAATEADRAGWRVEVNLALGRWRLVKGYGHKRQVTAYRPLDELPPERIQRAQAESQRQRALKGRG